MEQLKNIIANHPLWRTCFNVILFMALGGFISAQAATVPPADPPPPPTMQNIQAQTSTPPANIVPPPAAVTNAENVQGMPPFGSVKAPPTPQNGGEQFKAWLQGQTPSAPPPFSGTIQAPLYAPMSPPASPPPPKTQGPLTYEEQLNAMLNQLPPNAPRPSADSMAAFNMLLQQNVPLTPLQVLLLRQHIDMTQRAAAIPATVPPKPVSSTIMVNLSPGTTPPVIRLSQGYVTSLVFVDSTGTAWPIAQFDIGNPKAVNIQWDGKSNIILLQAIAPYSNGDIVIRLAGLPTPITLTLVSGQRVVDYRVDLHVPGIGPNTKEIPLGTALPNSANDLLLDVLNGVAPAGSRLLHVKGADAMAWILADRLFLRTRFTVLSPGWMGKMTSADGMQAYELPRTSSILISRYGEPHELKIEGF